MQPWRWVHHQFVQSFRPRISYACQGWGVVILFLPSSCWSYYQKECWSARVTRRAYQVPSNAPKISACQYMAGWKLWRPNVPAHIRKNLARRQYDYVPRWTRARAIPAQIGSLPYRTDTKWFYFWGAGCTGGWFLRHVLAYISHHPPRVVVYWIVTHFLKF